MARAWRIGRSYVAGSALRAVSPSWRSAMLLAQAPRPALPPGFQPPLPMPPQQPPQTSGAAPATGSRPAAPGQPRRLRPRAGAPTVYGGLR